MIDPQLMNIKYSMRRYYVDEFLTRQAVQLSDESNVLDVGGVRVRKRGQFDILKYQLRTVSVNIVRDKRPDIQADAIYLPLQPDSFDVAICTEVLEHVDNPQAILVEIRRVLRPGGVLLITVPFLYPIHADPFDIARYTPTYWQQALTKVGFVDIEIEKQGLFWSVLVDMARTLIQHRISEGGLRFRLWRSLAIRSLAWARRKALAADAKSANHAHPLWGTYTSGFGIRAICFRS